MKRHFRFTLLAALAVAVVSGLLAGCGCGLPGDAVAKVGDAHISKKDFNRQMEYASESYGVTRESNPDVYAQMQDVILDDLIQVELAKQKAADLGVTFTEDDVDDAVSSLIDEYFDGDQAALELQLAAQGMTMEDVRDERRDTLVIQAVYEVVVEDITSVPDEDVEAYYAANGGDYLTDPTVNARHILIAVDDDVSDEDSTSTTTTADSAPDIETDTSESTTTTTEVPDLVWAEALATAARVRVELLKGGSWDELAQKYSDDEATKESGGDLGEISQGLLAEEFGLEFDSTLFALQLDEISEPIETMNGYHIVQVTAVNEPVQKALEGVRDQITDILLAEAKLTAWTNWVEEAKQEIGVTYREDLRPTTTTTTLAADPTSTTASP